MTLDEALARIDALESECSRLRAENARLRMENAELRAATEKIPLLVARVEELEQRLAANSSNSSKPPSSDPPWTKPRRRGRPKKVRRGGQPGHDGRNRPFVPASEVDEFVDHRPECCADCGETLTGVDPKPQRWQVTEIPPIQPIVVEHRWHCLDCPRCGRKNRTPRPAAMQSRFGERVHARVSWLTGRMGMSKRDVTEDLRAMAGISMSPGTVSAIEGRMSKSLSKPYREAWSVARGSPMVHVDETTWYEGQSRFHLWATVLPELSVYYIRHRRNGDTAKELLGEDFAGAVCTDRHGAYNWIARRGLCWAHLRRNFEAMARSPGGKWYGTRLRNAAGRIITTWYAHQRGEMDLEDMKSAIAVERQQVETLLRNAADQPIFESVRRRAEAVQRESAQLWTFLEVPAMPPDNNPAERALRRGVLWRKRSFGTDSPAGSRYAERILTVVETLRKQDRDVLDFLEAAFVAHAAQTPAPSLIR